MNACDLMIDDIIKLKTDDDCYQPLKVGSVEFYESWCALYNFERHEWENAYDGFGYDMVEPITLTPEILKLNGFKKGDCHTLLGADTYFINVDHNGNVNHNGFDYRLSYKFPSHEYFALDSYDDKWYRLFVTEFVPKYVHEFQHALRMCGLSGIANNFKVIKS